jgi:hypothetical protein
VGRFDQVQTGTKAILKLSAATSEVTTMGNRHLMGPGYRGSANNAMSHAHADSIFQPSQWVHALWNGDMTTGRICRAVADDSGEPLYEVELPNVIGKGGTRMRVLRTTNELEPVLDGVPIKEPLPVDPDDYFDGADW